jgi:hypothetical protein
MWASGWVARWSGWWGGDPRAGASHIRSIECIRPHGWGRGTQCAHSLYSQHVDGDEESVEAELDDLHDAVDGREGHQAGQAHVDHAGDGDEVLGARGAVVFVCEGGGGLGG